LVIHAMPCQGLDLDLEHESSLAHRTLRSPNTRPWACPNCTAPMSWCHMGNHCCRLSCVSAALSFPSSAARLPRSRNSSSNSA
jgi:hypothetical protein